MDGGMERTDGTITRGSEFNQSVEGRSVMEWSDEGRSVMEWSDEF